jgi:FKBP-type peptidyl-prolyl cis-trans isomerase
MENKKNMSTILAVIIVLLLVGVFVFISISNKVNKVEMNSSNTNNVAGTLPVGGEVAKVGDTVSMNYTGRLENGTVFDSNVDPKFNHVQPFTFQLGSGQVIEGWDKGIVGMQVGEKKTLTIPSEDAYGAEGRPPVIPPNATLIFDVELLKVN